MPTMSRIASAQQEIRLVDNLWKNDIFSNVGGHCAFIKKSFFDKCFSYIILMQISYFACP